MEIRTGCSVLMLIRLSTLCTIYSSEIDAATETREAEENGVEIIFSSMSTSELDRVSQTFKSVVVQETNNRCRESPRVCGLNSWRSNYGFTENEVRWNPGYPYHVSERRIAVARVYLLFSDNVPEDDLLQTSHVLNRLALTDVLVACRKRVESRTGFAVVSVETTKYLEPPNYLLNSIIIPLAFAVLVVLIVIVISCDQLETNRIKEETRRLRREKQIRTLTSRMQEQPRAAESASSVKAVKKKRDDTIVEVNENSEEVTEMHKLPPNGASEAKEKNDRKKKRKKPKKTFDEEQSDSRNEYVDTRCHSIQQVIPAENIQMNIPVTSTNETETEVVDSCNENECSRTNSSDRNIIY